MEIYKITNTITNDFYIGSAVNFKNRRWGHISSLKKNKHKNRFIQNSWNKYGENAFIFEIIEIVDAKENLIDREQYWIDTLSPTFNLAKKAGSPLGVKHSEKSRKNMSLAHKGKPLSEMGHTADCNCPICKPRFGEESPRYIQREERTCICGCGKSFICMINSNKRFISGHNKPQLGKEKSNEAIEKQRNSLIEYYKSGGKSPMFGKTLSDDSKKKISELKSVAILQYNKNGEFIREWKSAKIAADALKLSKGNINGCLRMRRKTCGDFIWKYKN